MVFQEGWGDLPLELLSKVAGGKDSLKAMCGVCKAWRAGYEDSVSKIRQEIVPIRAEGLPLQPRFGRVHTLTLTGSLSNIGLWALGDSGVRTLDTSRCDRGVDAGLLATLAGAKLESLTLRGGEETLFGLEALEDLPRLEAIFLTVFNHTEEPLTGLFPSLRNLTSLTKLHLCAQTELADFRFSAAVKAVRGLPIRDLKFSSLSEYEALSGFAFEHLKGLPLTSLETRCRGVSDSDLKNLRAMPLTNLVLCGADLDLSFFNDREQCKLSMSGLDVLVGMPLSSLAISGFHLDPGCFEALRGLPLTSLCMSFEEKLRVNNARVEVILSLPLKKLELGNCILSGKAKARLHALPLESFCITE